jgi:uncharacterized membrane protein YfcA
VTHQDDTPAEVSFKWRRIYTFAIGALTAIGVGAIIAKLTDADALKWVAIALVAQNVVVMGFYMAGASLVDYAKLAAGWRGNPTPPPPVEQVTP